MGIFSNDSSASTREFTCNNSITHIQSTKQDYGACSGIKSTATLSTLGSTLSESLKQNRREEAENYLEIEQSVDDDNSQTIISLKKDDDQIDQIDDRVWFRKFSKKQILTLLSLCLVGLTSSMCMSLMAPFFPVEAREKGMSAAAVGLVFGNYALIMFLTSPFFGRTLPHFGAQFLLFSGLFLAAGCTVLFGALNKMTGNTFTLFCFVIRSLEAFGSAAASTAACTIVAQMFPENISTIFGLLETFVGIGMTLGPAIAGPLYTLGGFDLPFYVLGAFMFMMIPCYMCLLPKEQYSEISRKSTSMFRLLKLPGVFIMMSITMVEGAAWSFFEPFLETRLVDNFNLTAEDVSHVFFMLSATYGIFCPAFGWVADHWGHTSILMTTGMLLTCTALLLLGPSDFLPFLPNELWLNIVALILLGIATPLAEIPTFESMIHYALDSGLKDDIGTYSLVSGMWGAAFSFGEFVGQALGGVLVESFTFTGGCTGIAGLVLIPALMLIIYEIVSFWKTKNQENFLLTVEKKLPSVSTEEPINHSVGSISQEMKRFTTKSNIVQQPLAVVINFFYAFKIICTFK